jgi:hypothetical protein
MGAWLLTATHALAYLWGGNLDLVPRPPAAFALWLVNLYGARNGDDIGNLDVIYMLTVSFIVVAVCTFLARLAWRRSRKSEASTASER